MKYTPIYFTVADRYTDYSTFRPIKLLFNYDCLQPSHHIRLLDSASFPHSIKSLRAFKPSTSLTNDRQNKLSTTFCPVCRLLQTLTPLSLPRVQYMPNLNGCGYFFLSLRRIFATTVRGNSQEIQTTTSLSPRRTPKLPEILNKEFQATISLHPVQRPGLQEISNRERKGMSIGKRYSQTFNNLFLYTWILGQTKTSNDFHSSPSNQSDVIVLALVLYVRRISSSGLPLLTNLCQVIFSVDHIAAPVSSQHPDLYIFASC